MGASEPYPTSGPGGAPGSRPGTGPSSARVAALSGASASGKSVSGRSLMRNARPHATSRSPLEIVASTSWTLRPGRVTDADTDNGAKGTGRRSSTVSRVTHMGPSVGSDSTARASSAATGPPCNASGAHGPRGELGRHHVVPVGLEQGVAPRGRGQGRGHASGGSSRSSTHAGGRAVKPSSGQSIQPDMASAPPSGCRVVPVM